MKHRHQMLSNRPLAVVLAILAAAASLGLRSGRADDRDLLRQTNANPFLFVILDTSGSMNERPGDSSTPIASGDDPESKIYQAKKALYEAMVDPDNSTIHFGFATFNQDSMIVRRKHWVYAPTTSPGWLGPALAYPVLDVPYVFGGENVGTNNTTQGSCTSVIAVGSSGINTQVQQFPRTGDAGDKIFTMYVRQTGVSGRGYKTTTERTGGNLGDPTISVRVIRRSIISCGPEVLGLVETKNLTYQLIRTRRRRGPLPPFPLPDNQPILAALERTSYSDDVPLGPTSGAGTGVLNSCTGLDLNSDSASDRYKLATTINLSYPLNRRFDRGDFLPLDWTSTNRDEIVRRLAPNLRGMGETVPDFTQGRYFQTTLSSNVAVQNPPLVVPAQVPLVAQGFTPLGGSIDNFRDWYAGCHNDDTPSSTCATAGWKNVAETADPEFGCRPKYLLILTDGLDTCGGGGVAGTACEGARILFSKYKIETFVIKFGQVDTSDPTNVLSCLSNNGSGGNSGAVPDPVVGTRPDPFEATDEDGLKKAIDSIFQIVTQAGRSFSSAAVPTVQANFEDTIYVPNFTPLNPESFVEPLAPPRSSPDQNGAGATWDGHLNAYLKPIPVSATTGKPRTDILCTSSVRSGCFLWDAGAQLVAQAPTEAQLNQATPLWNIGAADGQRRVFFAAAPTTAIPATRRLFVPQTTPATQQDLWEGMKFVVADPSNSSQVSATNALVADVLKYTLQQKFAHVDATTDTRFVLGDIFHSNPVLVSAPGRIAYFDADVPNPPGTNAACTSTNKGYRCFRAQYQLRRRLVAVGSNDGQLHLFDGGIYRTDVTPKAFDNGTGKEVFSFIPRPMLIHLRKQAEHDHQEWGVDGTIQVDDVFIDPSHGGTPTATDREWRTVLLGGLREGGRAYYALDVTQPDLFDGAGIPRPLSGSTYVPSCWNGGTGCGTVPFGSVLWSFGDTSDEDLNGEHDLGDTWSTPNTGRIRIVTNALSNPKQYEDHYVAVFGGGMDKTLQNKTGNWLYMVDIETGKILYKRVLDGSAPSDPAAIDTDLDGYIDRVYIGTTKGWLYKADMTKDVALDIDGRITSADWTPFKIFDTSVSRGTAAEQIRPVYFPPSVVFDSKSGFFALGFGTGNREDLWSDREKMGEALIEGRFYFLLDTGWHVLGVSETASVNTTLPKTETDFVQITASTALVGTGTNFLNTPPTGNQSGWVMNLGVNQRLISKALTLSGILVFTGFDPEFTPNSSRLCERFGTSDIFTVLATNGDAVLGTTPESRSREVLAFVTNPFVETNISKNPRGTTPQPQNSAVCSPNTTAIRTLRSLFPSGCKFTAYTQDIKTFQVDTKLECIAAIPVCVREQNWRDQ